MKSTQPALLQSLPVTDTRAGPALDFHDGETAHHCRANRSNGEPCRGIAEWCVQASYRQVYICSRHFEGYMGWLASQYGVVQVWRAKDEAPACATCLKPC